MGVGYTQSEQQTQRCYQDSLVLLSSPSSTLLAFGPRSPLSAYNSHSSSFSQPCLLQDILALSAILHCTEATTLCSLSAPQTETLFPCFMAAEHGTPPGGKAALTPSTSHHGGWPKPLSQLAFPQGQVVPRANQWEARADALGRVEGAGYHSGYQGMLLTPLEAWQLDPSSLAVGPQHERPSSCESHSVVQ